METNFEKTKLISPPYESPVTDLIIELEKLRTKIMGGTTDFFVFFQIKHIFHALESIGSARIEGNNTTISDYLETRIYGDENKKGKDTDKPKEFTEGIMEIKNIEDALNFIEETIKTNKIDKSFISQLHKIVVGDLDYLKGEGDKTPGNYRTSNVKIGKSDHVPIDWALVDEYMEELIGFINNEALPKYDLLKIATVHHRFLWIHPFRNGNGRTVRLITYAMLVKYGFNVDSARILNPTAIFCNNRDDYYRYLAIADRHTDKSMLLWSEYVLTGLKNEIEKIDKLADYNFLKNEILIPAINYSYENEFIKEIEMKILKSVVDKQIIMANDIKGLFHNKWNSEISRQIRILTEKKMLLPVEEKARKYRLRFDNKHLIRGIIHFLGKNDFLPEKNDSMKKTK